MELVPCRYCKQQKAETFRANDLWYVRCKGNKKMKRTNKDGVEEVYWKPCSYWGKYEFLGLNEKAAIDNWNTRNSGKDIED